MEYSPPDRYARRFGAMEYKAASVVPNPAILSTDRNGRRVEALRMNIFEAADSVRPELTRIRAWRRLGILLR